MRPCVRPGRTNSRPTSEWCVKGPPYAAWDMRAPKAREGAHMYQVGWTSLLGPAYLERYAEFAPNERPGPFVVNNRTALLYRAAI